MSEAYTTIKIWLKTRHMLRQIAARMDESMVQTIDRLVHAELDRVQQCDEMIANLNKDADKK